MWRRCPTSDDQLCLPFNSTAAGQDNCRGLWTEVHEDHCLTDQGKGLFLSKYVKGQETCTPGVLCSWLPGKDNSVCSIRTLCSAPRLFFQQLFSAYKNEHRWLSTSFRKSPGLQTITKGISYLYNTVLRKAQGPEQSLFSYISILI